MQRVANADIVASKSSAANSSYGDNLMVEFKGISKSFVTPLNTVEVLHSVSFNVVNGSFTILHGPSGSGKSTVLNTLIGLEPPTSGSVMVDGTNLYELSSDQRAHFRANTIGMVHQDNYWVNSLSVLDNVAMPLLLAGWNKSKALLLARASIARVGLSDFEDYNPSILSGGQQQRISFARATVIKPKLLVADEPTGNLDSVSGNLIVGLLQDFNKTYKATVVLVTHNEELLPIADSLVEVKDGCIETTSNNGPMQKVMIAQTKVKQ